jgi:hypothetical protein
MSNFEENKLRKSWCNLSDEQKNEEFSKIIFLEEYRSLPSIIIGDGLPEWEDSPLWDTCKGKVDVIYLWVGGPSGAQLDRKSALPHPLKWEDFKTASIFGIQEWIQDHAYIMNKIESLPTDTVKDPSIPSPLIFIDINAGNLDAHEELKTLTQEVRGVIRGSLQWIDINSRLERVSKQLVQMKSRSAVEEIQYHIENMIRHTLATTNRHLHIISSEIQEDLK